MAEQNPFAEFDAEVGYQPTGAFDEFDKKHQLEPIEVPEPEEGRGLGDAVKDFVIVPGIKGAMGLTDGIIGLADLVSDGQAGKFMKSTGYDSGAVREGLDTYIKSDEQKAADQQFESAEGFVDSTKAAIKNPSVISNAVVESLPQVLGGGVVAGGIKRAIPVVSGAVAAGAGEGLMAAGSSAESQRQESEDGLLNDKQKIAAVASGVNTALLGAFGAKIANKLGIKDVDSILTGTTGKAKTSFPKALVSGGVTEGVFEELPQSVQEQMLTNWANNKPLTEGVDKAASLGMLSGAAMGSGVQAVKAPISNADEIRAKSKKLKEKIAEKKKQAAAGKQQADADLLAQVQASTDTPTPEPKQTLAAQAEAVNDGRKSAMLVTEGEQIPDNIDPEAKAVDTNRGTVIYKDDAVVDTLANEGVGAALDYGVNEKPEGATEVVTARDANGTVIQDVLTDGSQSALDAAQKVAGQNGSVEVRSAQDALVERQQNTDPVNQVFAQKISDIESRGDNPLAPVKKQLGYSEAYDYYKALEKLKDANLPVNERQAALDNINAIDGKLKQEPAAAPEIIQVAENLYQLKGNLLRNPNPDQYAPAYNNDGDLIGWKPTGETNVSTNVTSTARMATEPSRPEISDAIPSDGNMVSDVSGTARNSDNAATPQSSDGDNLRNGIAGNGQGDGTGTGRENSALVGDNTDQNQGVTRETLDVKANEAATSPLNDTPEPTEAQKEAGNYKVGKAKISGLDVSIENPDQSTRSGKDRDGNEWSRTMNGHYGYIKGVPARGNDKDHVDVNIKPATAEDYDGDVFVINQVHPDTGKFDEHKVYIGYGSEQEAVDAYRSNYDDNWKGFDSVARLSMDDFKKKLQSKTAFNKPIKAANKKPKAAKPRKYNLLTQLRDLGGILHKTAPDITGERHFKNIRGGYGQVFRKDAQYELQELIEDGSLDDFVPFNARSTADARTDEDIAEAYEYLTNKIANGDSVLPYESEMEIAASQYYEDVEALAIDTGAINDDDINALLQEAGYDEVESETESRIYETRGIEAPENVESRNADSSPVSREGTQARGSAAATSATSPAQNEVTRTPASNERQAARPVVESIVKMRRSAQELNKLKDFNTHLDKAKAFLNGEDIKPSVFQKAARTFKNLDQDLSQAFSDLAEMAKPPKQSGNKPFDQAVTQIQSANSSETLTALAKDIQNNDQLSESQAETLDDMIMDRIDQLSGPVDDFALTGETREEVNQREAEREQAAREQARQDAANAKEQERQERQRNVDRNIGDRPFVMGEDQDTVRRDAESGTNDMFSMGSNNNLDSSVPKEQLIGGNEATSRKITSSTYERAVKRSEKEVEGFVSGNGKSGYIPDPKPEYNKAPWAAFEAFKGTIRNKTATEKSIQQDLDALESRKDEIIARLTNPLSSFEKLLNNELIGKENERLSKSQKAKEAYNIMRKAHTDALNTLSESKPDQETNALNEKDNSENDVSNLNENQENNTGKLKFNEEAEAGSVAYLQGGFDVKVEDDTPYSKDLGKQILLTFDDAQVQLNVREDSDNVYVTGISTKEKGDLTKTAKGTGRGTETLGALKDYVDGNGKKLSIVDSTKSAKSFYEKIPYLARDSVTLEFDGKPYTPPISFSYTPAVAQTESLNDTQTSEQNTPDRSTEAVGDDGSNEAEVTPIDDFGERLEGARKDMNNAMSREMSDEEISNSSLSKIWPKVDVNTIKDPFVAALEFSARKEIPSKPRLKGRRSRWVEKVKSLRGLVNFALENENNLQRVKDALVKAEGLGTFTQEVQLYAKLPREHWHRVEELRYYPTAYSYSEDGKKIPKPQTSIKIDNNRKTFEGVSDLNAVLPVLTEYLNNQEESQQKQRLAFDIHKWRDDKETPYAISKKGDKDSSRLIRFATLQEARNFKNDNYDELLDLWEEHKAKFNVSKADTRNKVNRKRVGQDYRKGKDVTPEQFSDAFGFRGVQFGNWVNSKTRERQEALNDAYDALMDLAGLLDIPAKAISLEGRLGLAFGARGAGKYNAHYEPEQLVINLTKTKGAGSLAHEWFHALDNYFSHKRGKLGWEESGFDNKAYRQGNYITYKPEQLLVHKDYQFSASALTKAELERRQKKNPTAGYLKSENWIPDPKHKTGVRPEVEVKFADLVETLKSSELKTRSSKLDKGKGDGYWSRIIEMAARSFESYVIAKLDEQGNQNDYLANVVSEDVFRRDASRYPYVTAKEMPKVKAAFDALFETIESKDTDDGNVALFSRNAFTPDSYDAKAFADQIENAASRGGLDNVGRAITVGDTPDVLVALGAPQLELKMSSQTVNKVVQDKHEVSVDTLKKLPQLLSDPLMVLRGAKETSLVAHIRATDKNNRPIVAAIHLDQAGSMTINSVNRVASVYGKDGFAGVERDMKEGKLLYADTEKALEWYASTRVQFSAAETIKELGYKFTTKSDLVNQLTKPKFKRNSLNNAKQQSFNAKRAEEIADELAKKYPNIPRVKLYSSHNELPIDQKFIDEINNAANEQLTRLSQAKTVADKMAAFSINVPNIQGVYQNGDIMINLGAINDEEHFRSIFAHEGIGHLSVEAMLNEVDPALMPKLQKQVINLNKLGNKYISSVWQDVERSQPGIGPERTASEVLAHIAERGDHQKDFTATVRKLWQKIVDGIKAFAKLVFDVKMNDQDVRDIVAQAERYAKGESSKADLIGVYSNGKSFFSKNPNKLPKTITVNGTRRPTSNSAGNPIHSTLEGVKNFWRWFDAHGERLQGFSGSNGNSTNAGRNNSGDSADTRRPYSLDRSGRPTPFYHGTAEKFETFKVGHEGRKDQGWLGEGVYLTNSEDLADVYADYKRRRDVKQNPNAEKVIMPLYAALHNPYYATLDLKKSLKDAPSSVIKKFTQSLVSKGYDGVVMPLDQNTDEVLVFDPNQVKSTSSNSGDFSASNDNTLFSRSGELGLNSVEVIDAKNPPPEETKAQKAQRKVQDKFNRFEVIQNWLKEQGVNLSEAADVYLAETLMSGRVSTQKEDFRETQLKPLIEETQKAGFNMDQVADYLKAQHAPEANKRARELQGNDRATAYGVTDKEAMEVLKEFQALDRFDVLKDIANKWRGITEKTKQLKIESGLLTPEMVEAWEQTYQHYVPVKGTDENQKTGLGKGLHVNARNRRRLGHGLRDEAIIENILRDHESAITLAEKNRVGKSLIRLLLEADNEAIGTIAKPVKRKVLKQGESSHIVTYQGQDIGAFDSNKDAKLYIDAQAATGLTRADFSIEVTKDPVRVMLQASPLLDDNEVHVYVNGHAIRVQINDELAASAYKNMGVEHLHTVLAAGREVNNWLSKVYTGYSPDFIFTNPIRDAIQGSIVLTGNHGAGMMAKIYSNYFGAIKELYKHFRENGSSEIVNEYRAHGGSTGGAYLTDLERIGNDIQSTFEEYQGALATYKSTYEKAIADGKSKKFALAKASLKSGAAGFKKIPFIGHFVNLMEKTNAITENALRVATFKTLSENGLTKDRAAFEAKELMNFNRKGEYSNVAGALYLFFNPAMQGNKLIYESLVDSPHKKQAQALTASMTLAAITLSALAMSGDDEDREQWENTPDYVKDANIVFNFGGKQVTITLPYGFRVFWGLGNIMHDASQGKDKDKLGIRFASMLVENFSPIGAPINEKGEINAVQVLPTAAKMAVGPSVNQDGFGRPVTPYKYKESLPDSQLMFRGTHDSFYDLVASKLNELSGGSNYEPGYIDVSPETLKFWVRSTTGGTGQFFADTANIAAWAAQGQPPQNIKDVPIARRFAREADVRDSRSKFWEIRNEVTAAVDQLGAAKRAADVEGYRDLWNRKGMLYQQAKLSNKMLTMANAKRDAIQRIRNDDSLTLKQKNTLIRKLEQQEQKVYDMFIKQYELRTK